MSPVLVRPDLQVFETLPVPLVVVRDNATVYANPALAELFGVGREGLIGRTVNELLATYVVPNDRQWLSRLNESRINGGEPAGVLWARMRRSCGSERDVCIRTSLSLDGEEAIVSILDAEPESAAKRLSERLAQVAGEIVRHRDEASILGAALRAIGGEGFGVAFLLVRGDDLAIGPANLPSDILVSIEKLHGRPLSDVRIPLSELPHLRAAMAERRTLYHQDARNTTQLLGAPEGRHKILEAPVVVEDRPYALLVVQGEALTPAAAATLDLFARNLGPALENVRHHKRAAQRLKELAQLQDELVQRERLAALGEAAAVVAHEVRNPLGAIVNAVALLKRGGGRVNGDVLLGMIEEEARRIEDLVRDLLDLARPLDPRIRPIELAAVVRQAVELVRDREATNVAVELIDSPDCQAVAADPQLVQVAVDHLVRNAVEASPDGGRVAVRIGPALHGTAVSVEDQGPGVSEKDALRIFEPFFTTRATGSGLGLAVVKRVAEIHGGSVQVRRGTAGGALFELILPLA